MSFSFVSSTHIGGSSGGTTPAINTTGSKLIVLAVAGTSTVPTVSDSQSNSWTQASISRGSGPVVYFFYCITPTVNASHTFTVSGSISAMVVGAYSATNTPSLDTANDQGTSTGTTFATSGAAGMTPSTNGCLITSAHCFPNPGFTSGWAAASGWTADDVQNYTGGTNYGVGMVHQIQTTATTIAANTQTATWTGAAGNLDSITIAFKEVAGSSLTITTPNAFEVHQQSGSTGSIQITGTVSGSTEDIEASFNGGAYSTIATAVAPGNYSGTLTGQTHGMGTLTVRKKVTTTTSATVANVGIGDVFLVIGDSRAEGRGTNAQTYTASGSNKATDFRQDNLWKDGNDPSDTGTSIGSHWPLLGTIILADQGFPVAFITTGTGSTDMAGSANSWAKPNTEYTNMQTTVTNSTVAGVKAVLGEFQPNAIVNASTISLATYQSAVTTMGSNLVADIVGAPKFHLSLCGSVTTGSPPNRTLAQDNLRGATINAWNAGGNVRNGANLLGQQYSDGVHPQTDAQLLEYAQRWWLCLKEWYYGGSVGSSRGPRLSGASWDAGRNHLTVVFDRALKTGLTFTIGAWHISDNGSAMTISGIAYHGTNPNALVITTSAAATGPNNTTTVTFGSGEDATGAVIPKSTDITLPVGGPIQIPAEPIYAASVSEFSPPPVLSSPTASAVTATTWSGTVSTTVGSGTLYKYISTNTTETAATIKSSGTSQTVVTTGVQNVSGSGLTPNTSGYYAHYVHTDTGGNDSNVANSPSFATPAQTTASSSSGYLIGVTASGQLIVIIPN
jgi:hypothetical protein